MIPVGQPSERQAQECLELTKSVSECRRPAIPEGVYDGVLATSRQRANS